MRWFKIKSFMAFSSVWSIRLFPKFVNNVGVVGGLEFKYVGEVKFYNFYRFHKKIYLIGIKELKSLTNPHLLQT